VRTESIIRCTAMAVLLGACLLCASCAGVRCNVTASDIDQPVSFTSCVYDGNTRIVTAQKKDVLNHFTIKKRCWAVLWGTINLTRRNWDVSELLGNEITAVRGDAIVDLTIEVQGDWYWWLSSIIPIIPDYQNVIIEGGVIRLPAEATAQ